MLDYNLIKLLIFIIFIVFVPYILTRSRNNKIIYFTPEIIGIIGVIYQVAINRNESFWQLGFTFSIPKVYFQGILTICGVLLIILAAGFLFGKLCLIKDINIKKHFVLFLKLLVFNTVAAVFTEELVFRGCIQRQLLHYFSPINAILISSAIFGLWHIPFGRLFNLNKNRLLLYPLGAGLVGILLGYFYNKSQSLIVAGILHGLWNAIVYTIWGVGENLKGVFADRKDSLTHPEYGIIGIIVLTLSALILLLMV